jgi:hypothetical protein
MKRDAFTAHYNDACLIDCSNRCGEPQTRSSLLRHLDVCRDQIVPCEASRFGCPYEMRRAVIDGHQETCDYFKQLPQYLRIQALEEEVASLVNTLEQKSVAELELEMKVALLERRLAESESMRRLLSGVPGCVSIHFDGVPLDVCALDGKSFIVADSCDYNKVAKIHIISANGDIIRSFGTHGKELGSLSGMISVCALDGNIAVADSNNNRIQIFSPAGDLIRAIKPSGENALLLPSGICVLDGNLVVSDCGNDRIQVFSPTGKFVRSFGSNGNTNGELRYPGALCILDGNVVVVDRDNERIQIFSATGEFVRLLVKDVRCGVARGGICVLDGNIVMTDCYNHRIQVYSGFGELRRTIGSAGGIGERWFQEPLGVCVLDGTLIVTSLNKISFLS